MKRFPWLAVILVVGVALAVREALRAPMWMDEIYTLRASSGGLAHALAISRQDVHPPLHLILVSLWASLVPATDLWLRLPSVLFGAGTIVGTFLLGRAMFGRGAGLLAAALVAVHPQHVHFSQELRSFGLLWMLFVYAWWLAWDWVRNGGRAAAIGYVVVSVLALYTHYFTGIALAFVGLWGVLALMREPRRLAQWIGLHAAIAALFVPQMPMFMAQSHRLWTEHWIRGPRVGYLVSLLRHLAFGSAWMLPVFGVLTVAPLARSQTKAASSLLWLATGGPILLSFFATVAGAHVFTVRYMYFAIPAVCALTACGLVSIRSGGLRVAMTAVVLLVAVRSMALAPPFPEARSLEHARKEIASRIGPDDVLFCADTHTLFFFTRYMAGTRVRLLWLEPEIPYFEGRLVIPDSLVVGREAFAQRDSLGAHWWAVRVRHGGTSSEAAREMFERAAGAAGRMDGVVEWWDGTADRARRNGTQ